VGSVLLVIVWCVLGLMLLLVALFVAFLVWASIGTARKEKILYQQGVPVLARIVECEERFGQPGTQGLHANGRVIYTFDPDVPDLPGFLDRVAAMMNELEYGEPATEAEKVVAERMRIKLPCPFHRPLPTELTEGRRVYEVAIKLKKTLLPRGGPAGFVYCLAVPHGDRTWANMISAEEAEARSARAGSGSA
jgi:hypothetical protein